MEDQKEKERIAPRCLYCETISDVMPKAKLICGYPPDNEYPDHPSWEGSWACLRCGATTPKARGYTYQQAIDKAYDLAIKSTRRSSSEQEFEYGY